MLSGLPRRHFLAALLAPLGALLAGGPALYGRQHSGRAARVAVLLDADGTETGPLRLGVQLGAEEAQHTASLLRRSLEYIDVASADMLRSRPADIVIAAVDDAMLPQLAAHGLVLNVGSDADALRGELCSPAIFHVVASRRMRTDALAAWNRSGGDAADARAVEWHPALNRFGAEQLNDRCMDRFGVPMHAGAWVGWMAAKIAAETSFRAGLGDHTVLRTYLRAERTRFDGHKGRPLSFRAWDQQLRQPLYVVSGDRVVAELPDTRAPDLPQSLDDYGTAADASRCNLPATEG
jgi:hypothetical protein